MKQVQQMFLFFFGVLLLLVGVLGLVMPVVPGWLFLFMGLSMAAPRTAARVRWWLFRRRFKNELLLFDEWLPQAEAGYTTRHFSLFLTKTDDLLSEQNQALFAKLLHAGRSTFDKTLKPIERFVLLKQVHGDRIAVLDDPGKFRKPGFYHQPSADGAVTCVPDLTLLVFSADCLPVFFKAGEWVGLAHAGWRGTKAGIAVKMLDLISERSGVGVDRVRVILGPRIGSTAYEVGTEFRGHFTEHRFRTRKGRLYFDLAEENTRQLVRAGARAKNIADHGICTVRQNRDFYSFRKEGEKAGRIVSFLTKL